MTSNETPREEAKLFVKRTALQHLTCRNIRHSWKINRFEAISNEEKSAQRLLRYDQVVARRLVCTRCGTQKVEYFGREVRLKPFIRVIGHYEYVEGYTYRKSQHDGQPAPDRSEYFEELLGRRTWA